MSPDPVDGMGGYLGEGLRMREGPASGEGGIEKKKRGSGGKSREPKV